MSGTIKKRREVICMYEIIDYEYYDNVYAIVKFGTEDIIFTGFLGDCVEYLEKELGLTKKYYWN